MVPEDAGRRPKAARPARGRRSRRRGSRGRRQAAHRDPEHEREQPAGDPREPALAREQEHERSDADCERRAVRVPEIAEHWPSWRIVSPPPASIPNSFGSCFTVTKIASPKTNPSITGRERNWAMKPSRRKPASRRTRREEDERGRVGGVGARVPAGRSATPSRRAAPPPPRCRPRRRAGSSRRSHTPRARHEQRVQARLRRQAREPGVRDHLRHEQPPDRRAGDRVEPQIRAVVRGQPGDDRDVAADSARLGRGPGRAGRRRTSAVDDRR